MTEPEPLSVLVVDDDPPILSLVADLLTDEGYRVRAVYDGLTALAEIERDPPDVVVSDVMMPHLDGIELVRELRRHGHAVPVVLMSAVYDDVDLPGVRFVPKPFGVDYLLAAIKGASSE